MLPLNMSSGLSCNFSTDIAKDKYGLIWVATEDGLCQFDGERFTVLTPDNSGLSSADLNCILDAPGKQTTLWIGTKSDGLNIFDYYTGEVRVLRHDPSDPQSLANDEVSALCAGVDGGVWAAMYHGGVSHIDVNTLGITHYGMRDVEGLPSDMLWSVHQMSDGRVLMGHTSHGMSLLDPKTRRAINYQHDGNNPSSIAGNSVYSFMTSCDGRIWVGTNNGVDVFDPASGTFSHIAKATVTGRIYRVRQLSDGCVWLATENHGVAILSFDGREGLRLEPSVKFIGEGDSESNLYGMSTRSLIEDDYGNVWVSLYGCGVNVLCSSTPPFSLLAPGYENVRNTLKAQSVLSTLSARDGSIILGHDGDGIQVLDKDFRHKSRIPSQFGLYVQALMQDSRGRIWVGAFDNGAYVVSADGSYRRVHIDADDDVRAIIDDNKGYAWITSNRAVYKVSQETLEVVGKYIVGNHLGRAIALDKQGNLWAGFYSEGVRVFSPEMEELWSFTAEDSTLAGDIVKDIICDARGRVWVSTSKGLTRFTPASGGSKPHSHSFRSGDGLENTHVRAAVEDGNGNIWLSTNNGLACVPGGDDKLVFYNSKDNIPRCNFNDASGCLLPDGRVIFGCTQGICVFSPSDVLRTRMTPKPIITQASISTSTVDSSLCLIGHDRITLSHDINSLSLTFNTLDPSVNPFVVYGYTIDGLQERVQITDQGKVELRGLAPGSYALHIRSQLHNQPWSVGEASLAITVLPPWWRTWWAMGIYVVLALAALTVFFAAYRRRTRLRYELQMVKREREREEKSSNERMRFFTNITHELRTPLTLIVDPLNTLATANDIGVASKRKLAMIRMSAMRLSYLISQIREFTKTEVRTRRLTVSHGDLTETVRSAAMRFQELTPRKNIEFIIDIEEPDIFADFDPDALTTILDNLISNALKYTTEGTITVSMHSRETEGKHIADISVADTGCGIAQDALPHIFERYYQENGPHQASGMGIGLALAKRMADLHGAQLTAQSQPGVGTTLTLSLDIDATYPDAKHVDQETTKTPAPVVQTPAVDDGPLAEDKPPHPDADSKILLIVEDDLPIRSYIAEAFSDEFVVMEASDGVEALQIMTDNTPDIVIADVMMPRMNGFDFTRQIRSNVAISHIPVILLTAKDTDKDKEEGYDAGADSYITKPFSVSLLHSRVDNLLARRKREAELTALAQVDAKRNHLQESLSKIDQEFFDRLNGLIEKSIGGETDVTSIAYDMAMSSSNLYRKMKAMTGLSTVEYIRRFKMHYAERLLLEGRYSISEVAFMVGMSSTAYFRRCFKAEFGDIPSEYIRKLKESTPPA